MQIVASFFLFVLSFCHLQLRILSRMLSQKGVFGSEANV